MRQLGTVHRANLGSLPREPDITAFIHLFWAHFHRHSPPLAHSIPRLLFHPNNPTKLTQSSHLYE
jgi:hypothetical protein